MGDGTLPYADFSVFGPHGDCLAKKLKFASCSFSLDGTWARTELPGPPEFQSWWRCFQDLIGPACCFIVYHAESRMRSERLKRKLESDWAKATADGGLGGAQVPGRWWISTLLARGTQYCEPLWQTRTSGQPR
eukprot:3855451-Amphidinium_carterae.7